MKDSECIFFLQWALPKMNLKWSGFRKVRGQVKKRLQRRLQELSLSSLDEYQLLLTKENDEWRYLDQLCRITISRFYRNKGFFDALGSNIIPALLEMALQDDKKVFHCWSAGCASGEEAYTLALLWHLQGSLTNKNGISCEIIATDSDPFMCKRAQEACYPASSVRELPKDWLQHGFEQVGEEYCLQKKFQSNVEFQVHDIRHDPAPSHRFHLILCRNLAFTYFDEDLQLAVLKKIKSCLLPGGALAIGCHESLPNGQQDFQPWLTQFNVFRQFQGS